MFRMVEPDPGAILPAWLQRRELRVGTEAGHAAGVASGGAAPVCKSAWHVVHEPSATAVSESASRCSRWQLTQFGASLGISSP